MFNTNNINNNTTTTTTNTKKDRDKDGDISPIISAFSTPSSTSSTSRTLASMTAEEEKKLSMLLSSSYLNLMSSPTLKTKIHIPKSTSPSSFLSPLSIYIPINNNGNNSAEQTGADTGTDIDTDATTQQQQQPLKRGRRRKTGSFDVAIKKQDASASASVSASTSTSTDTTPRASSARKIHYSFRYPIPDFILFQFLEKICVKTHEYYLFNYETYKNMIYKNLWYPFKEEIEPYYHESKKTYITRDYTYNNITMIIRQICNSNDIYFTKKTQYNESEYCIEYSIYYNRPPPPPMDIETQANNNSNNNTTATEYTEHNNTTTATATAIIDGDTRGAI